MIAQAPISLNVGSVITHSVRIRPETYSLTAKDPIKTPVIVIRGDNITVDFNNATLRGTSTQTPPDQRRGLAILVDGGRNVTIKNAKIHGYRLAIYARNTVGLTLQNCDWSYNWKQHLKSTPEREDESDWMSFHHNEHDEWIYGSGPGDTAFGCGGTYLSGCRQFHVDHCTDTGSQCGLMLNRSNEGYVFENDFSFLSGIGIGLYRSSNNQIFNNSIDYCVRGYSHGIYSRGQDSASILIYEQSNHNEFISNSATRGGDGFFLWAGQTTMDTGKGGCNDNYVMSNDFSHAPTNGIEATFSRNQFADNRCVECWHGVWGGFSYESKWLANVFQYDGQAFAIEHGQDNTIQANTFDHNDKDIALWMTVNRKADIPYIQYRDTASKNPIIAYNQFNSCWGRSVSVTDTSNVDVRGNVFRDCPQPLAWRGKVELKTANNSSIQSGDLSTNFADAPLPKTPSVLRGDGSNNLDHPPLTQFETKWVSLHTVSRGKSPKKHASADNKAVGSAVRIPSLAWDHLRGSGEWGRDHIIVTEWGPYDYRYPMLLRSTSQKSGALVHLKVLGPKGEWSVKSISGAAVVGENHGPVPGDLTLKPQTGSATDYRVQCVFNGGPVTSTFGVPSSGKSVPFSYSEFVAPIDWHVTWYKWDALSDPRKIDGWRWLLSSPPIKTDRTSKLQYSGAAMAPGLPEDHYATVAEGDVTVAAGKYVLDMTTDDGARAFVDGKPVITDAWHYQGPTQYTALLPLSAGKHHLRIEHFQIDGYATLQVDLKRAP